MKTLTWVVVLLIVAVGGYLYVQKANIPAGETESNTAPREYESSDFSWKITNSPRFEETMPYQSVVLEVGGKTYGLENDEYMGCSVNESWPRETNELSKVVCWYAGGGHELGVFLENGKYVVKERWVQESGGPEVNAATEGSWKVLFEVS